MLIVWQQIHLNELFPTLYNNVAHVFYSILGNEPCVPNNNTELKLSPMTIDCNCIANFATMEQLWSNYGAIMDNHYSMCFYFHYIALDYCKLLVSAPGVDQESLIVTQNYLENLSILLTQAQTG